MMLSAPERRGMGDITIPSLDLSGVTTWLQGSSFNVPNWMYVAAGAVFFIGAFTAAAPGGSQYSADLKRLRSKHRGYKRALRYAGGQLDKAGK